MVKDYKLNTNNAHIGVETYFNFLARVAAAYSDQEVLLSALTLWLTVMSQSFMT